jgi:hypothetical protein
VSVSKFDVMISGLSGYCVRILMSDKPGEALETLTYRQIELRGRYAVCDGLGWWGGLWHGGGKLEYTTPCCSYLTNAHWSTIQPIHNSRTLGMRASSGVTLFRLSHVVLLNVQLSTSVNRISFRIVAQTGPIFLTKTADPIVTYPV